MSEAVVDSSLASQHTQRVSQRLYSGLHPSCDQTPHRHPGSIPHSPPRRYTTRHTALPRSPHRAGVRLPRIARAGLHFLRSLSLLCFPVFTPRPKRYFECLRCARVYRFKRGVQGRSYREGDISAKTWEGEGFCPAVFQEK